jgi:uncharacterized protein (DUF302 family)
MTIAQADLALRTRSKLSFEGAVDKVTQELKKEGFGVLTHIDVQATLKEKLEVDFRKYVILGACNPPLAHAALQSNLEIGLLLPCNVIVYEEGDGTMVSIIDPAGMMSVVDQPELGEVAQQARERLQRVIDSMQD